MTANRRRRPITRPIFHHTTFATLKLDEMVEFYEKVAGLEPVFHSEGGAWLTNDAANHRIALLALPGLKEPEDKGHTIGLHHTAFEYAQFDQWLDNYERLAAEGIRPFLNLDHGMTMSMYYQDPEGNGVEIQVDAFGDWSKSKEWMWASEEFSENPIGAHFDPDQLVAARDAGLAWEEIHRRCRAGEYLPSVVPDVYLPELW
jgi:catechol-2,3-dioxygenase